jgi:hypothetical protein
MLAKTPLGRLAGTLLRLMAGVKSGPLPEI